MHTTDLNATEADVRANLESIYALVEVELDLVSLRKKLSGAEHHQRDGRDE